MHTLTHLDQFPVFFRFIGYDRLFGSHYDEYIIEYNTFDTQIDSTQFDIEKSKQLQLINLYIVWCIKFLRTARGSYINCVN